MNIKLVAFDLDDTIAGTGRQVKEEDVKIIKEIEDEGVLVVICSGKPAYYLCGFVRQMGLKHPVLIGENGAVIQFGVQLPPEEYYILPYSKEAEQSLRYIQNKMNDELSDLFFQPDRVGITPFCGKEDDFIRVEKIIKREEKHLKDVEIYRHTDSYDIVPKGIDKGKALKFVGELLGIDTEEMAAAGNDVNDYPMFACVKVSLGVGVEDKNKVLKNFKNSTEMLKFLKNVILK